MNNVLTGPVNKPILNGTRMLVVTTGIRRTELYSMLCSVLSNVSMLQVKVIFHSKDCLHIDVRRLRQIAELNKNLLSFGEADSAKSVAAVVAEEIIDMKADTSIRRVISADDDHLFDEKCFAVYSAVANMQDHNKLKNCVISPCVVDIADAFGYADWQASPRKFNNGAFETFVKQFGLASAAHQNWSCNDISQAVLSGYINNCWMAPVDLFSERIIDNMLNWKKGVKGKDLMIQREMQENGVQFVLSPYAHVLHTGVNDGVAAKHWQSYSDVFKSHAETKRVSMGDSVEFYDLGVGR